MTHFSAIYKSIINVASGVVIASALSVGLLSSAAFAQQAVTAEDLQVIIEQQQAELDAAIAKRDKTQRELEAKRMAFEKQNAKQKEIEARMEELCKEQELVKPGSLENCMAGKTTK